MLIGFKLEIKKINKNVLLTKNTVVGHTVIEKVTCEQQTLVTKVYEAQRAKDSQSAFLRDCFFLEGLEMTLILLLRKTPMSALLP